MRKLVTAAVLAVTTLVAAPASAIIVIGGPVPDIVVGDSPYTILDSMLAGDGGFTFVLSVNPADPPVRITNIEFAASGTNSTLVNDSLATMKAEFSITPPTTPLESIAAGTGSSTFAPFDLGPGESITLFITRDTMVGSKLAPQLGLILNFDVVPVPVPAALPMMAVALGGGFLLLRRRKALDTA